MLSGSSKSSSRTVHLQAPGLYPAVASAPVAFVEDLMLIEHGTFSLQQGATKITIAAHLILSY
ncbi:uncharacterized protein PHALS_04001 [Plasmopara halstedii]|uniref:Uncharacterized protein n=1 Tax=Plasmopara halstedii TaxID=4781 RepID=A0A0P1A9J3_PLAHL|nr:uncharacterized protein PHALS_04001 [Plasmopara halstedii]CEG36751.1 hypothetical protein PHALS_04001 [Plasmopara halstedii]|eukprot:XP_024573120.1 hypothetical protein PHALS_04001 [Plasmopara halstedii]